MSGVTQVSEHTFEIGGMSAALPQEPSAVPSVSPAMRPTKTVAREPASGRPLDLRAQLCQLRARLRDVKRDLRNKKALERERDQLQRLIKAATLEIDNVRRLRAAG